MVEAAYPIERNQRQVSIVAATNDIEEGKSAIRPGGFHPVQIGDVYDNRYTVLLKLGFGLYSTVWLVQDQQYVVKLLPQSSKFY